MANRNLTTERLNLRPVQREDVEVVFRGLSNPQVIKYYGISCLTMEAAHQQMDWYRQLEVEGSGQFWLVQQKNEMPIGVAGYYFHHPVHRKAEIGAWLQPEFWRMGFMTEAVGAIMRYMRQEKQIHRIEGFIEPANEASLQLVRKLDFVLEGTLRDCEWKENRFIDLHVFANLPSDTKKQ